MDYNENLVKNACNLIAKFEGLRLKPYSCPSGFYTIGYGHRILPNEHFTSIDKETATSLLLDDFKRVLDSVHSQLPRIFGTELYSTACLCYNVGTSCLDSSKNLGRELRCLNKWYGCGSEQEKHCVTNVCHWISKYVNIKKDGKYVPLNGLVLRREAEIRFFKGQLEYFIPKNTKQNDF